MVTSDALRQFALVGAQQRVQQLQEEIDTIVEQFPELRQGRGPGARKAAVNRDEPSRRIRSGNGATGKQRRKRRTMTTAERKAVGERMKKYWAARKKKEASGAK